MVISKSDDIESWPEESCARCASLDTFEKADQYPISNYSSA